ncbi:MAG: alkaline phosphatase [Candidatus Cloacimonetes bacterium]|nr:alkaline phosphatase [Candidatus Cloacimonadota bacterium]
MRNRTVVIIIFSLFILMLSAKPKNIIVCIGDGMGFNDVTISNFYEYGKEGMQVYEQFPVKLAMSTWSLNNGDYQQGKAWNDYKYIKSGFTDSAASATAMATGVKTKNGILGTSESGEKIENLTEKAIKLSKSAGIVTTVPYTHATPAGFTIHAESRNSYQEIAQEIVFNTCLSVAIGGGNPDSRKSNKYKYIGPEEFWKWLPKKETTFNEQTVMDIDGDSVPDPWTFITVKDDFLKYAVGDTPKRLLGVNESVKYGQQSRDGDTKALPFVVPLDENIPSLSEMTAVALNVLDNNPEGFFLLVEGGAIDPAAHENEPGRLIEEMLSFNETIRFISEWVEKNSNWKETLVIVTADHETGCIWGEGTEDNKYFQPIVNKGKGVLPGFVFNSGDHTNSLVPFYAKGADAKLFKKEADEKDPVRGKYLDNAEMGKVLNKLWEK